MRRHVEKRRDRAGDRRPHRFSFADPARALRRRRDQVHAGRAGAARGPCVRADARRLAVHAQAAAAFLDRRRADVHLRHLLHLAVRAALADRLRPAHLAHASLRRADGRVRVRQLAADLGLGTDRADGCAFHAAARVGGVSHLSRGRLASDLGGRRHRTCGAGKGTDGAGDHPGAVRLRVDSQAAQTEGEGPPCAPSDDRHSPALARAGAGDRRRSILAGDFFQTDRRPRGWGVGAQVAALVLPRSRAA